MNERSCLCVVRSRLEAFRVFWSDLASDTSCKEIYMKVELFVRGLPLLNMPVKLQKKNVSNFLNYLFTWY